MQVVSKIDHLITELTKLKPTLSDDPTSNEKRFSDLLTSSLENDDRTAEDEIDAISLKSAKLNNEIPSWVDPDYGYDPNNPRKPNMRELLEAMSGQNVEDLYQDPQENWKKINRQASEMLHGVIGANEDTRYWSSIMNSNDILTKAREQIGLMYDPKVGIQSNFDDEGILIEQIALIKDSKGNILSSLSNNVSFAKEVLLNFGATKKSIPTNIEEQIDPKVFDNDLLAFLKNFDNNSTSVQQVIIQSAGEVIANKLSQEIPSYELAKL